MKKRYKYPLSFLAALLAASGMTACSVYHNIGTLPDAVRFAHLPYYRDGQFHARSELPYYPKKPLAKVDLSAITATCLKAHCR